MAQFIIHPQDSGEIAVVIPAPNCGLSIEEIARKDVPAGVPFLIVNDTDLPDWSYSAAWEADFSQPHGHGIGADEWFAQRDSARMAATQAIAEHENLQFDALQKMRAEAALQQLLEEKAAAAAKEKEATG